MTGLPARQLTPERGRSLIRQAVRSIVLAEIVCMVALTLVSVWHEREVRLHAVEIALEGRADSLFGAVQDAEDTGAHVELDPREMRLPTGDAFAVYDMDGRRLGASEGVPDKLVSFEGPAGFQTERWHRHTFRVLRRANLRVIDRAESNGVGLQRPVLIVYVTSLDGIWRESFRGVGFYLGTGFLLLGATTLVIVGQMRRVLQPLGKLAEAAAAVSPRRLQFIAPAEALALSELRPLGLALTSMVTGLRDAFSRQHRFLGDAAHELKTAVAVVRSSLQVTLLRRRSAEEYETALERAVQDNKRVEDLVARMLLMAQIEEGDGRTPEPADLNATVALTLRVLGPLAQSAGVTMVQQKDELVSGLPGESDSLRVPVGAEPLGVLIQNLVTNAVEHSAHGELVRVDTRLNGKWVELRVTDQGEGIPDEALPHVFERFYRADRSRARVSGGVGLGLSVAKAIVEGGGGTIIARSQVGEGTEMIVTLPFVAGASVDAETVG